MSANGYLATAYIALVVVHAIYLWNLKSRINAVREELERLELRKQERR